MKILIEVGFVTFFCLVAFTLATPANSRAVKTGDPKEGKCENAGDGFWVCTKGGKVWWCPTDIAGGDTKDCQEAPKKNIGSGKGMPKNMLSPLAPKARQ